MDPKEQTNSETANLENESSKEKQKDVKMKKGNSMISVSQDFVEHYTKQGYEIVSNKTKVSVAKETEKIIKEITKSKKE